MAIKFLKSNTFSGVYNQIIQDLKMNDYTRGKHIILVPDQYTLAVENEVFSSLDIKCSFNIEVVSFSRFAVKLLGKELKETLNQQACVLLMKKVIIQEIDNLECFKRVAMSSNYANEMYAVLTNIRNSGVTSQDLEKILPKLKGMVASKTKDILTLYKAYDSQLMKNYSDIGARLTNFKDKIKHINEVKGMNIYLFDFHNISKIKMDIVVELMKYALNVTVGVVGCSYAKNFRLYPDYITVYLTNHLDKMGLTYKALFYEDKLAGEKKVIQEKLFSYAKSLYQGGDYVQIFSANSLSEEVEGVAREIRRLIVECKYRYKDISVVCHNTQMNTNLVERIFANYEIPYYCDIKTVLSTQPIVKLYRRGLDVLKNEFKRESVLAFVKESFFYDDYNKVCDFENYVLKYNIDRSRFLNDFSLGVGDEEFCNAQEIRKVLVDGVKLLNGGNSIKENVAAIKKFLKYFSVDKKLNNLQSIQEIAGLSKESDVSRQSGEKLLETLAQIESIFGNEIYDFEQIHDMVLSCLDSITISNVPQFIDSVFIGGGEESRFSECKTIFILGASEGRYPNITADVGIMATRECSEWNKNNVTVTPTHKEKTLMDKFFISQLLLKAKNNCIISFNTQEGMPSQLVNQLVALLNINIMPQKYTLLPTSDELNYARFIGTRKNAKRNLLQHYADKKDNKNYGDDKIYDYLYTCIDKEDFSKFFNINYNILPLKNGDAFWRESNGKTFASVSAIERYYECPFKFSMQYRLKLKERYTPEPKVNDIGSLLHAILEEFLACESYKFLIANFFGCTNAKEYEKIVYDCAEKILDNQLNKEEFLSFYNSANPKAIRTEMLMRSKYMLMQIMQIQLRSKFQPYALEYQFGFGENDKAIEISLGKKNYYIRGFIDRIDEYQNQIVVVDYKSKSKVDFSLKDIYYGLRVQLLAYLNAFLQNNQNKRPFGVFYLPIPFKYNKEDDSYGYKYTGYLIKDDEIMKALDTEIENNSFLPISFDKKGEVKSKDNLLNQDKIQKLLDYAITAIKNALDDIKDGFCMPRPLKDKCTFCDYKVFCRSSDNPESFRKLKDVEWGDKDAME